MKEGPSFSSLKPDPRMKLEYYVGGKALENLVIPQDVTRIRKEAFNHGHNIKKVTFHENIEYIDENAFQIVKILS